MLKSARHIKPRETDAPIGRFDYSAPGEVFMTHARRHPISYRRFDTAAEAIRYAMEDFPASLLVGVVMEVDEERFDHMGIRQLYGAEKYPLERRRAES